LQFAGCDLGAGFFEPVGDEVGAAGDAAVVGFAQGFDVVVAEFAAHDLPPRNGGLPTMTSAAGHSASLPSGLSRASRCSMPSSGFRMGLMACG
jgi:acetaldehyde dehydrogenase (acetylating)